MNNQFNILVVHHNKDMDGIFSGTLSYIFFSTLKSELKKIDSDIDINMEYVGYDYGKDESIDTWLNVQICKHYQYIQFIDVTPPIEWLKNILVSKTKIDIFDHHKICEEFKTKFETEIKNNWLTIYYDSNYCASSIFFEETIKNNWYFDLLVIINDSVFDEFNLPLFFDSLKKLWGGMQLVNSDYLELVDSYDTWKWKNEYPNKLNALALNEYVNQYDLKHITIIYLIKDLLLNNSIKHLDYILELGYNIINFKKNQSLNENFKLLNINYGFDNIRIVIINNKANSYSIDKITEYSKHKSIEISCIIFYNDISFDLNPEDIRMNISIRQIDKEFDCIKFVKWLTDNNGGGHFGASGGSLLLNNFINKLNLK